MNNFWLRMTYRQAMWLVLLFALLITLPLLAFRELQSGDETRVAGIAAEMLLTDEWSTPHLNGQDFLEYPPLYYWCVAASCQIFGVHDFAARLPAALYAIGCLLLLLLLAKKIKLPPWSGLAACLLLATSAQFFGNSRKCMVDIALAFFVLLAITGFCAAVHADSRRRQALWLLVTALGMAGGILTKGLIGLVLPAVTLGGVRFFEDLLIQRKILWHRNFQLAGATLAGCAIAAIWYVQLYYECGSQALYEVLIHNNFGRFSGGQSDHAESFFYYFIKLPSLFMPWLPLLPFALWYAVRNARRKSEAVLLLCYQVLPFLLLCLASGKRVVYLLPLFASSALLCAFYLSDLPQKSKLFLQRLFRHAPRRLYCRTFSQAALAIGMAALLLAGLNTAYYYSFAPRESLAALFAECRRLEQTGYAVELYGRSERTRGAAVFYLGHLVPEVNGAQIQPSGTVRIYRSRKPIAQASAYPDSHWLRQSDSEKMTKK